MLSRFGDELHYYPLVCMHSKGYSSRLVCPSVCPYSVSLGVKSSLVTLDMASLHRTRRSYEMEPIFQLMLCRQEKGKITMAFL